MDAPTACLDEETLFGLAAGRLDGEAGASARAHLDSCEECRALLGHTLRSLRAGEPVRDASIGRYIVEAVIGAGAMGVVYRARDPLLGRAVALKLLGGSPVADERLLREAEAMAKLSHPNVVAVHDAGRIGDRVFLAMELVDGETLAGWLNTPRTVAKILARFTEAGRGLAAAHAAGIAHRDFKPHNVLCGSDGRVRVADFGLAIGVRARAREGEALVGTPAYMAPEQLDGRGGDARSDQFGFCVALFEALYGARPFTATTLAALRTEVSARDLEPPRRAGVSAAVRRAIGRGLRRDPSQRFPSMDALLAALRPPVLGPRRMAAVVGLVLLVGGVGVIVAVRATRAARVASCARTATEIDPVWSASQRDAGARAFSSTSLSYASPAWAKLAARIDAYASRWRRARVDVCRAAADGVASTEETDRRGDCLIDRREELGVVVELLSHADAATVERAASLVDPLAPIEECADPRLATARKPVPVPPTLRAEATAVTRLLAEAAALERAGRVRDAEQRLAQAWPRVRALSHLPLEAEAHLLDGRLAVDEADTARAVGAFEEAASAGNAGRADELAARAHIALVDLLATTMQDRERGLSQARYARVAIDHVASPDRLEGDRQLAIAKVERAAGHADRALAAFAEAEQLHARAFGATSAQVGEILAARAGLYEALGRHADATRDAARALTISEESLGADHVGLIRPLTQLGVLLASAGDYEGALGRYERALAIAAATVGREDARTATVHAELGELLARLGRGDEAERSLQTALAISERTVGAKHPDTGAIRDHLGVVELERGDARAALAEHERALAILESSAGARHPRTGRCLHHLAADLLALGRSREALAAAERALAIIEEAYGKDARDVAVCCTLIGEADLALGRAAAALPPLERGLSLREARHSSARSLAESRFALARALSASGGDGGRARALAESARAVLAETEPASAGQLPQRVDAWLRIHR